MKVLVLVAQSCLTLYDPMDHSLPGASVHGIFQGVSCHFLLQGAFATPASSPRLLYLPH